MATKRKLPPGVRIVNGRPVFSPFTPAPRQPIPATMYDPTLDATLGQAGRGFADLLSSAQTDGQRMITDYGLQGDTINRDFARSSTDLATNQQRETQNYGTATAGVQRQYGQLANRQVQQQAAYGVLGGGAALQAARKRAANQALDQAPLDTAHARATQDFATQTQRLGENTDLARGQLNLQYAPPDAANPLGGRSWQDLGTKINVGARELGALGIDTQKAKAFQAAQLGYTGPPRPYGEQVNPITGGATREYRIGGMVYTVGKGGRIISKRKG